VSHFSDSQFMDTISLSLAHLPLVLELYLIPFNNIHVNNKRAHHPYQREHHDRIIHHHHHSICRSLSDQYFVYIQKDQCSKEMMKAKVTFEMYTTMLEIQILAYHVDTVRLSDNNFANNLQSKRQQISYHGVDVHHKNARMEKAKWICRIKSDWSWRQCEIIRGHHVTYMAICGTNADEVRNHFLSQPLLEQTECPTSDTLCAWHTYYLLNCRRMIYQWYRRCSLGVYLGPLLVHAYFVHLILSLTMGLESPLSCEIRWTLWVSKGGASYGEGHIHMAAKGRAIPKDRKHRPKVTFMDLSIQAPHHDLVVTT